MRQNAFRIALIAAFAVVLALVPTALAGKGGGGKPGGGGGGGGSTSTGSSLSLVLMDGATEARWGGRVTFNVSSTATKPQVGLRCFQNGNFVYDGYVGYWDGYMFDPWFTLKSNYWVAGVPATCHARLFYNDSRGRQVVLATMSFPVAP